MIFTVCNPVNSIEAQIALALNLLCGFGIQEIADAFLTNKEVVYKRINRSKDKLRDAGIKIQQPTVTEIDERIDAVLITLYLMFSEGYYSISQNTTLRKDLCSEATRLTFLMVENEITNRPAVMALYALMCFHASRFEARTDKNGETILYHEQDDTLWDKTLIEKGTHFLNRASVGTEVTKYHLEAGIAYWHTLKDDSAEKWESILDLYNRLLVLEYSPVAALNRTFALAKVKGKEPAIVEAEKLKLDNNPFYYTLLGSLYSGLDNTKAIRHFETALRLTSSAEAKATISRSIAQLMHE
jgi:RNA polymerase sigma-70 factor (ECF subfamily)